MLRQDVIEAVAEAVGVGEGEGESNRWLVPTSGHCRSKTYGRRLTTVSLAWEVEMSEASRL